MNTLIVTAHPDPRSANAAFAHRAREHFAADGEVRTSDLYAMDFDPRESPVHFGHAAPSARFFAQAAQRRAYEAERLPPQIADEIAKLHWTDLLVLQFPLWWFGMPAILKGWMDRVFVYGGLYSSRRRFETGALAGKRALLSVTTGSSALACSPQGREGDTRLVLWPAMYSLHYVGFDVLEPLLVHDVHAQGGHGAALAAKLAAFGDELTGLPQRTPVRFNVAADWDGEGRLRPDAPVHSPFIRQPERGGGAATSVLAVRCE